jgi:hypothetical protein
MLYNTHTALFHNRGFRMFCVDLLANMNSWELISAGLHTEKINETLDETLDKTLVNKL